jgi:hypothetical protein
VLGGPLRAVALIGPAASRTDGVYTLLGHVSPPRVHLVSELGHNLNLAR